MKVANVVHYRDEATGWLVLAQPYAVYWKDMALFIGAGFRWDGASVPHAVRSVLDNDDCGVAPGLVHDFVYRNRGIFGVGEVSPQWRVMTRSEADRLFLDMMEAVGVPLWKRLAAYSAVRVFGGSAWRWL